MHAQESWHARLSFVENDVTHQYQPIRHAHVSNLHNGLGLHVLLGFEFGLTNLTGQGEHMFNYIIAHILVYVADLTPQWASQLMNFFCKVQRQRINHNPMKGKYFLRPVLHGSDW